jgi:hypothetical protein
MTAVQLDIEDAIATHRVGQPRQHSYVERGADFYATPACAVEALLRVYQPVPDVWEPACGDGAIVKVLRALGHPVIASDLHDWGCDDSTAGVDFLAVERAPHGCACIVTNPPYQLAQKFVEHALRLVPDVAMLLRLAFLDRPDERSCLSARGSSTSLSSATGCR